MVRVCRELDLLWGTALVVRVPAHLPWPDFVASAGRALEQGLAGRHALLQLLAPDASRPGASHVAALAEVLLVPRERRTEALTCRSGSPAWDIRRLLTEYALWSRRVDAVLGRLTKGYCAAQCCRRPVGCCSVHGYDLGLTPEVMMQAQALEALGRGCTGQEDRCRYHGPRGCALVLFKTPACAGMLCDPLTDHLHGRFPASAVEPFLEALSLFRNHTLDRETIFLLMARVVATGEALGRPPDQEA